MTRLSFRLRQLGPHETITDEALAGLVGQIFTSHVPGHMFVGTVLEARVSADRWIVLGTDLDLDAATQVQILRDIGVIPAYSVRHVAPPDPFTFTPQPPDWSGTEVLAPTRAKRSLLAGLKQTRQ